MHLPWRLPVHQTWRQAVSSTTSTAANASIRRPRSEYPSQIQTSSFSTSPVLSKRKHQGEKKDHRITLIRYFLLKPKNPRPLRFSRQRYLRHWTIHRAWMLHKRQQREAAQLDLERQYWAMNRACEELRLMGEDGMPSGKDEGRLFRIATRKEGVWQGAPIEYARMQTEWPSKDGWDHAWTRN